MERSQIEVVYQRITDMTDYINTEEAFLQEKTTSGQKQLADLEEKCKKTEAALADTYQNAARRYRTEMNQMYAKLNVLSKEIEKQIQKRTISEGILKLVKGKSTQKKTIAPKHIEVHSVEECQTAVRDMESAYRRLSGGPSGTAGASLFSRGKDGGETEQLEALYGTIILLIGTIRQNSQEMIERSVGRQRVEAVQTSTRLKQTLQEERKALEAQLQAQNGGLEEKLTGDLEKKIPDTWLEDIRYRKAQEETRLNTDISLDKILKNGLLRQIIQKKCQDIVKDHRLQIPVSLIEKDRAYAWMLLYETTVSVQLPLQVMHSMMADVLQKFSGEKLKFVWIDPMDQGNSFSPFASLRDTDPDLFAGDIAVKTEQIKALLRNALASASERKIVCVTDFPKNFDEECLQLLQQMLKGNDSAYMIFISQAEGLSAENKTAEWQMRLQDVVRQMETLYMKAQSIWWRKLLCSLEFFPPKRVEMIVENYSVFNMRKKYPYIMNERVYAATQMDTDTALEMEGEIRYGILPTMMGETGRWKTETFPKQMVLGKICYPPLLFKHPGSFPQMEAYSEMEHAFTLQGIPVDPSTVNFPWQMDLRERANLYIRASQEDIGSMTEFTHALIWNFLDAMPVSKVNICVFDSEQKGNSIFPFSSLRKQCTELFGKKIYTNEDEMYAQLRALNEKIDNFIQEKRGEYRDFLEYNEHTPKRSESAVVLVIYDFPGNMNQQMMNALMSILQNGNACGIYTILCHNTDLPYMGYEQLDAYMGRIHDTCINLECKDGHCYFAPYEIEVKPSIKIPREKQAEFIQQYVAEEKKIKQKGFGFSDILPKEEEWFQASTADHLSIPVGIGDGDQVMHLVMGEKQSHHALIAGATGSGKSVLLHSIIMSSMLKYSPDELQLYLMDFKSGTEFAIYDKYRLPHICLLALDAMQEFGESILERLVKEMEERADAFKEAGGLTKIRDYVEHTGKKMPRILVVMDEFQILYNDETNRKVAMNCAKLTQRLVTEGRAYGIHLLMATQSTKVIMNLTLSTGTIEQMRIRVGLKCSDADSRYLFGDENSEKALDMMKGPTGTAVMSTDYTNGGLTGFRGAYCKPEQDMYLHMIEEKMKLYPANCQVFEGKRTEKLTDSLKAQDAAVYEKLPLYIHYGIPIKVAPPYIVKMTKKPRNNLLICCGAKPGMANRVANDYMISALMNQKTDVYCMDGNLLLEEDGEQEAYEVMASATDRFHMAENRGDIIRMIDEMYEMYIDIRKKGKTEKAVVAVLKNLEYLDIVRDMLMGEAVRRSDYLEEAETVQEPEDGLSEVEKAFGDDLFNFLPTEDTATDTSSQKMQVGDELIELLDRGSAYGIYFAVSALDYQTIRETMIMGGNYDKEILKKFPNRIIYALNDTDAQALIPDASLGKMTDNTVYYTDGLQQKFQLKPFVSPDADELRELLHP